MCLTLNNCFCNCSFLLRDTCLKRVYMARHILQYSIFPICFVSEFINLFFFFFTSLLWFLKSFYDKNMMTVIGQISCSFRHVSTTINQNPRGINQLYHNYSGLLDPKISGSSWFHKSGTWKGFVCISTVTINVIFYFLTMQWINFKLFIRVLSCTVSF